MELSLTLSDDERHACRRAGILMRAISRGLQEIGSQNLRAVEGIACGGEPGERRGVDRLGVMEPRVAAEHLVRGLPGQRYSRFSSNRLE